MEKQLYVQQKQAERIHALAGQYVVLMDSLPDANGRKHIQYAAKEAFWKKGKNGRLFKMSTWLANAEGYVSNADAQRAARMFKFGNPRVGIVLADGTVFDPQGNGSMQN